MKKNITFKIIYLNFIGANKPHPITTTRKKVSGEIDGLISSKPSTSKCSSGYGSAEMPIAPVMLNSGEHVAAVWFNEDKNELQWYLGIASETANANDPLDKILISYLYRSGQSSSIWKLGHSI